MDSRKAYAVLHYAIARAFMEGKTGTVSVNIPIEELKAEHSEWNYTEESDGMVLRIKIETEWDEYDPDADEFTSDLETPEAREEKELEELPSERTRVKSKNKKSH